MDYRAALVDFYRKHNPLKLVEVDALLRKYKGREEELLHALRVKYKVNEQGESIVEETPPAPPPPPPPPPRERPAPRMEAIVSDPPKQEIPREEPHISRMEPVRDEPPAAAEQEEQEQPQPRYTETEVARTVNDYSGDYKGNTAAERAAYWKKELQKREQERKGKRTAEKAPEVKQKATESKQKPAPTAKVEKMKVVREPVVEQEMEEEETHEPSNPRKKIAIIVIVVVLLIAGVVAALLNDTVQQKLGIGSKKEAVQVTEKTKKEGLDPGVMSEATDSVKKTGEFALEEEEGEEKTAQKAPSVEDAMNEQPSSTSNRKPSKPAQEESTGREEDSTPPATGEVVRKKHYIGYGAVTTEEMARTQATELRRKGFDKAGYFFIPDYYPGGKELYRVFVGPFDTEQEAEESAVNVRSESPSAYTFYLK